MIFLTSISMMLLLILLSHVISTFRDGVCFSAGGSDLSNVDVYFGSHQRGNPYEVIDLRE